MRTRISIVFNLLAGIALVMVLTGFAFSLEGWRKASRITERNAIAEQSLAAVKHFAFERGRTNVILRGKTTISESNRKFIDERRRHADTAMATVLSAAPDMPSSTQAVERSWSAIKELRQEVERDFALSLEERDKALPGRWLPAANALVASLEALLGEASQIHEADFHFAQLATLRLHALQFRNAVGSESTRLAGELSAGRVLTAAIIRDVNQLRGGGQHLWSHIEQDIRHLDDATLNAVLDKVRQVYFQNLRTLMDAIVEAAQQNQLPTFTTEHYTQQAVPALDSIIEMVDAPDQAIADYAALQLQRAQRLLAGALIGLTLTLLLIYLGRRVLAQDLIHPLQVILDRIYRLRGSTDRMPTVDPGNLTNIGHALDLLEDALCEVRAVRIAAETSRQELDAHRHHLEEMVEALDEAQRIAGVGNWELDLLTNKLVWSDEIFRIFEIDKTRFVASFEAFLAAIHPEDRDAVNAAYQQSLETLQPYGITHRLQMPDGRIKYVHEQCESFFDSTGKPLRSVRVVQDVTERKQLENSLAIREGQLRATLEVNPSVAVQWYDEEAHVIYWNPASTVLFGWSAEEALGKTLDQLIYADEEAAHFRHRSPSAPPNSQSPRNPPKPPIAPRAPSLPTHELRTPMNGVLGMIELAKRRMHDPQGLNQLAKARTSADRLLGLLNDILDLSKIEAERMVLDDAPLELASVRDNLLGVLEQKAHDKGLRLEIDLPADLAYRPLLGDALRLGQILINLVGNAIKFTEQGEVVLSVRTAAESTQTLQLRFAVRDSGIGIDTEAQSRLFHSFEQADNSMTRKYGGTGLGLAISKRLVEMMGGEIGLESIAGQGSTFWIVVPLKKREPSAVPPAPTFLALTAEKRLLAEFAGTRILLAEDEPITQIVSSGLLEDVGCVVDLAEDGQQALALARQNRHALILMDMQMPVMNGIESTKAIRADSLNKTTPILAMTANAFDEDRDTCLAAGMNAHISKPVNPTNLYETLLAWLEKSPIP